MNNKTAEGLPMKKDYSQFDRSLMAYIASGRSSFAELEGEMLSAAKPFCTGPRDEPDRIIDRRLQALRKAGKIRHDSKAGWRLRAADGG